MDKRAVMSMVAWRSPKPLVGVRNPPALQKGVSNTDLHQHETLRPCSFVSNLEQRLVK